MLLLVVTLVGVLFSVSVSGETIKACSDAKMQTVLPPLFVPGEGKLINNATALSKLLELVTDIKGQLYGALTNDELQKLAKVQYCVDTCNTERWGFYYKPARTPTAAPQIILGLQSLRAISNISGALGISETLSVVQPFRWWRSYALYLRRTADWREIVDPMTFLAVNDAAYEQRVASLSIEYFRFAMAFIMAHEISHILLEHESRKPDKFSFQEWNMLVRKQEEFADRNAIQILTRPQAFSNELGPSGAVLVFVNWHIIDGVFGEVRSTHPADTRRMISFSNFVLNEIDHSFWPDKHWNEMRRRSESIKKQAELAEDPSYFEVFDENAQKIRVEELRLNTFH